MHYLKGPVCEIWWHAVVRMQTATVNACPQPVGAKFGNKPRTGWTRSSLSAEVVTWNMSVYSTFIWLYYKKFSARVMLILWMDWPLTSRIYMRLNPQCSRAQGHGGTEFWLIKCSQLKKTPTRIKGLEDFRAQPKGSRRGHRTFHHLSICILAPSVFSRTCLSIFLYLSCSQWLIFVAFGLSAG